MIGFLLRGVIAAVGLWLATRWLPGVVIDAPTTLLLAGLSLAGAALLLAVGAPPMGRAAPAAPIEKSLTGARRLSKRPAAISSRRSRSSV